MESSSCVVDSSLFVAFYRESDAFHADAMRIIRELLDTTLIVHPYVIQETVTVLAYGDGVALAKQFLSDISNASNVIIPAVDVQRDMRAFMTVAAKLSFTDIALIALARETGVHLITFDRQMLAQFKKSP